MNALSPSDEKKKNEVLKIAVEQLQQIADIRESLKDTLKAVAEDLGIEYKYLTKSARIKFKDNLAAQQEEMEAINDILDGSI